MNRQAGWYRHVDRLFERPFVFNLNQIVLDGGKERQIRRFLQDVPYDSVLDIGCGTGNWAELAPGAYLGIDTSSSFIAACEARYADDPLKQFIHADATELQLPVRYDLALMVSVLHHLPDEAAERLLRWIARSARYFFVLDLYPIHWNPVSRWLYKMDRGSYIREPAEQEILLSRHPDLRLVKKGDYFCPNGLYRHTLFLFENRQRSGH